MRVLLKILALQLLASLTAVFDELDEIAIGPGGGLGALSPLLAVADDDALCAAAFGLYASIESSLLRTGRQRASVALPYG